MISVEDIKTESMKVVNESKALLEQIDELKEWDSFSKILANISKIVTFVTNLVVIVENVVRDFADENVTGNEKLDAAAQIMDDIIKGNIWIEIVDKYLFKMLISTVVHYINQKYGKLWPVDAS